MEDEMLKQRFNIYIFYNVEQYVQIRTKNLIS